MGGDDAAADVVAGLDDDRCGAEVGFERPVADGNSCTIHDGGCEPVALVRPGYAEVHPVPAVKEYAAGRDGREASVLDGTIPTGNDSSRAAIERHRGVEAVRLV